MTPKRSPLWLALGLVLGGACSEPTPQAHGERIDLLGRQPDERFELSGPVVPRGDIPGTLTWGASEGPGWSQEDLQLPDKTRYRETNQAKASLFLHAARPAEREIVLALWCAHAQGEEPAPVRVRLNGLELSSEPLALGTSPSLYRLHAAEALWVRGANQLEFEVPLATTDGKQAWDTLALASTTYGDPAQVKVDTERRRLELADGTGARYALELVAPGLLSIGGRARSGGLHVRTGELDKRSGRIALDDGEVRSFSASDGRVQGTVPLTLRPGAARLVELEWEGPAESPLVLEELSVREERSPTPRPPIVFVSIDTFAARHLSTYGYARKTTPNLERFQADAVTFEHCLANAPWTLPSYLSVMSGLYPRAHWVTLDFQDGAKIQNFDQFTLAPNRWTVAEALRARGYRTGAFVDTQWLSPQSGVDQGFDTYDGQAALAPFEDVHAGIELIVKHLVPPWLAGERSDRPPFLFLHALDAHGPYLPEEPFRDRFLKAVPPGTPETTAGSINQTYRTIPEWMGRTFAPSQKDPLPEKLSVEALAARYDETLLKVDNYLGELFALLRAQGLYDEAVIVITGDHGEFFGPGVFGHGIMRESVLHVPLFLKLPGNAHGGERKSKPVALVDVYPTLLELAGISSEGGHGTSLLRALEGHKETAERSLFSEGGHVEQYALTLGRWRLVEEFPGSESGEAALLTHPRVSDEWLRAHASELLTRPLTQALLSELSARPGFPAAVAELRRTLAGPYDSLYDVEADPAGQRDLAAEHPELVARLKPLLEREKARSRQARAEADPILARPARSAAERAALEALGYGGGSDDEPGTPPRTDPRPR